MIEFYHANGSPFGWRVQLSLEHKGLPYNMNVLSFGSDDFRTESYTAINPRQLVPSIVDDGYALYESATIVEYLEDKYPDRPRLLPDDPQKRSFVRRLVNETDFAFYRPVEVLVDELFRKPGPEDWDQDNIAGAKETLIKELALFESYFQGDFLAGELSTADFALYPLLSFIGRFELKKTDLGLSQHFGPKILAWREKIKALPYYETTYPPHWRPRND